MAALRANAHGETHMRLFVEADGRVERVVIMRGSGPTWEHRLLDMTAAVSMAQCKVKPATQNGEPVTGFFALNFIWKLE
jgi:outer membrane biosynthesis protein TonB